MNYYAGKQAAPIELRYGKQGDGSSAYSCNKGVAQRDLDSALTTSEQADAQVKQAAAALVNARNQVANTSIYAPIAFYWLIFYLL